MKPLFKENSEGYNLLEKYDEIYGSNLIEFCIDALSYFKVGKGDIIDLSDILVRWNAPGRFHHTAENHLMPMLVDIMKSDHLDNDLDRMKLVVAALFHDIVYDKIKDSKDVDASVEVFINSTYMNLSN